MAGSPKEGSISTRLSKEENMIRYWLCICSLLLTLPGSVNAQKGHAKDIIADYSMPELFLQHVKYVAHTGSTTVYLRTDPQYCTDGQNNPLLPCYILPYRTETPDTFTDIDLFSVTIPGKSLRDVIAFVPRFGPSFTLRNFSPDEHDGFVQARLNIALESPAFPEGSVNSTLGDRIVTMSLPAGKMFGDTITYTRHGMINRQWLRDNVELSEEQVNAFFDNDITIHVKVRIRAALLSHGSIYVGVLIEGY